MNDSAYEEYVAEVVRSLSFARTAKVHRNRRYPGLRQPGTYQIDVACEFWIDDALFFLTIVECKNWRRLIDRPQVQKFIQTRDAVGAHKCAFASPVGYTREAIEVAKANGVALWIVARGTFSVAAGGCAAALALCSSMAEIVRQRVYAALGYEMNYLQNIHDAQPSLAPHHWAFIDLQSDEPCFRATSPFESFYDPCLRHPVEALLRAEPDTNSITRVVHSTFTDYRLALEEGGLTATIATRFTADFVTPMITIGFSSQNLFRNLEDLDREIEHHQIAFHGDLGWLNEHERIICVSADPSAPSVLRLENNTAWANTVLHLQRRGYLETRG